MINKIIILIVFISTIFILGFTIGYSQRIDAIDKKLDNINSWRNELIKGAIIK